MNMNVNFTTQLNQINYAQKNFNTKANCVSQINFSGQNQSANSKKSLMHKVLPYIFVGSMLYGGVHSCSENRISGAQDFDGAKIEYFDVKPETKDSLIESLIRFKKKLNVDNDFLKGISVNITNTYDDMNDNHSFKTFLKNQCNTDEIKGTSFYSDKKIPRIIIVQEGAHNFADKFFTYTTSGNYSNTAILKHSLMHEVGHQFDFYFGHDHDAQYSKDFDNMIYSKEKNPDTNPYSYNFDSEKEENIDIEYRWNNGLSDRDTFKEAMLKDCMNIAKLQKENPGRLPINIEYYTNGLDLSKKVSFEDIDLADGARSETYANLFSYAVGENDGDKEDFINAFPNSYRIVRRDILEILGPKVLK